MKIYASSYHFCSQPTRFRQLFGRSLKVAVITNALDFSDDLARRRRGLEFECEQLSALSLQPFELDA
jgi:hypothetical protein